MNDGIGGNQVQPAPAGLQADQEQRHLLRLERAHRFRSVCCIPAQFHEPDAGRGQRRLHQVQHGGKLGKQQDAPPFGDHLAHHFQQVVQLAGCARQIGGCQLHQPWIAADLPELQERIQHQHMAAGHAAFGDALRDAGVHRLAYRFVQFPLIRRQGNAPQDRVLGRQFGGNSGFRAAQDEGADAHRELAAAHRVAILLDRRTKPAGEIFAGSEQAGHEERELGPEFAEVVFDRRAGQAHAVPGVQPADRVRGFRSRIFNCLRLIQHHQMPGQFGHFLDIAGQDSVGGDDDMHAGQLAAPFVAVEAIQHRHPQMRRETGEFRCPVRHQRGRHHDQRGAVQPAGGFLDRNMRDGLRGLTQPHVVGQHCAQVVFPQILQPIHAVLLVRPQGRGEAGWHGDVRDIGGRTKAGHMGSGGGAILPAGGENILEVKHIGGLPGIQLQAAVRRSMRRFREVLHHRQQTGNALRRQLQDAAVVEAGDHLAADDPGLGHAATVLQTQQDGQERMACSVDVDAQVQGEPAAGRVRHPHVANAIGRRDARAKCLIDLVAPAEAG